jgi:hypothetical protein
MGYLIEPSYINRTEIFIPSVDAQIMSRSLQPYTLIATNNEFYCLPIACYIREEIGTLPYVGYGHLHLSNTGNYGAGDQCGTMAENSQPTSIEYGSMLINFQTAPNRFGGNNFNKDLQIFWDTTPTAGDGDLKIVLYWIKEYKI